MNSLVQLQNKYYAEYDTYTNKDYRLLESRLAKLDRLEVSYKKMMRKLEERDRVIWLKYRAR